MSERRKQSNLEIFKTGIAWHEINLINNPFCALSKADLPQLLMKTVSEGSQLIYQTIDEQAGKKLLWKVKPDIELGYPGPFDLDVITTVKKIATDNAFPPPNPLLLPSLRRICQMMKISTSGENTQALKESLKRIASTVIETNGFYFKGTERYEEEIFTLWTFHWRGTRLPDGSIADSTCLWFSPPFYKSLLSFYVRPIDYNYYLSLPPLAKRIYIIQGRKFYGLRDSEYTREEYETYCQQLPSVPQQYFSKAKQVLNRAHQVLKQTYYLSDIRWEGTQKEKPWSILYYPGPRAEMELEEGKRRLARLQRAQRREAHDDIDPQQVALIRVWVGDIYQKLEASSPHDEIRRVKNLDYYKKLARLIVAGRLDEDLVRQGLSETYTLWRESKIRGNRSQYFTGYLKRQLKNRGQDLKALLEEV